MSAVTRLAKPEDAPLLPDIERSAGHLFREIPGLEWIAGDHVMTVAQHLPAIHAQSAWVACEEEMPVAFLSAERMLDTLHIYEVSVHATMMGRGLGRRLIEAAIAAARASGLSALTLTTFRDVPWNEPYYQRLGFETLALHHLDARLTSLLAREVSAGLPGDRRCAMRLNLVLAPSSV
jgi:GNAT superfamily N-acetyltransferase